MNPVLLVILTVVGVLYVGITLVVFAVYTFQWWDYEDPDYAKAAFRAPLWPVTLLTVARRMWDDSHRPE